MKIYFKILKFAGSLRNFVIPFFFTSLIAGVFGVLNLVLLKPLLDVLFGQVSDSVIVEMANKQPSTFQFLDFYQKYFAQSVLNGGKLGGLKFVCFTILGVSFVANVSRYFSLRLLERFKTNMVANLRQAVFEHTLHLHLGFYSNEKKGELISRITTDVQEVENSIANSFSAAIKELILLSAYLVALFYISWKLTLFSLIVIPITGAFLGIVLKRMRHNAGDSQQRLSNLISLMDEAFGSMRVVKAFLAEGFISKRFYEQNTGYRKSMFAYASKREMANPFSEFIGISMVASLLYFGGSLILEGTGSLSASTFISYIAIFSQVIRPAKEISQAISTAQRGLASGQRVMDLLGQKADIIDEKNAAELDKFEAQIEFKNVGFSYAEGKEILKNVNLTIKKGQTVALVGASGGGKSTIADLLIRFYDVQKGTILIDEKDIKTISQKSLREHMGMVTQEPMLYNDSIFNNIAFGRNVTKEEVENAAKIANAHDFILAQTEGYETNIGDRGSKLSGGQKQRLSIARAILQNPPILILDEATSALDTESEKLVQDALANLMKNRTSLVIAHRLSTIQNADQIFVIQNGEVVEEGTHQSLFEKENGYYKKLVTMQEL
ncbi:ABC transporter ATP-binding protein [Lacihabitans sp. LS3-19]|uniref:ABC transporter ATP-binding protein n=1 Tax=Lacihabitans sp. LS3-19 TaxID=2487335 RepID=UPI0020CBF419|nr:ABC transporter ATP-binding protein [Lacihabitans sp. LS3-19]MCP9768418.1 ABC transporter ATP-binding protein [Lacihabitans sp. LS3-19]